MIIPGSLVTFSRNTHDNHCSWTYLGLEPHEPDYSETLIVVSMHIFPPFTPSEHNKGKTWVAIMSVCGDVRWTWNTNLTELA